MKNCSKLTSLILMLMLPLTAHAERWFEVEMILFERTDTSQADVESFSDDEMMEETRSLPYQASLMNLSSACETCSGIDSAQVRSIPSPFVPSALPQTQRPPKFVLLKSNQLQLTKIRQKLANHASFKPTLHLGFQMPVDSRRSAVPLHLFAGKNYQDEFPDFADPASPTLPAIWEMEGLIKIYLHQYLFVDADLILRKPGTKELPETDTSTASIEVEESSGAEVIDATVVVGDDSGQSRSTEVSAGSKSEQPYLHSYRLDQLRRLRSGEIHYLDHPQMGVVFQIRKMPQ